MTPAPDRGAAAGLLLAAGAGTRMGAPKALLRTDDGEHWLTRAVGALSDGGCARVVVVLGAAYDEAVQLLPADPDLEVVRAEAWADGMGESLRAGLQHLSGTAAQGAVVSLVDLPDVTSAVVARVVAAWAAHDHPPAALARAVYDGWPGHPVVLGRDHWEPLLATVSGDVGAQRYLTRQDIRRTVESVECADLATGVDVDRPPRGSDG